MVRYEKDRRVVRDRRQKPTKLFSRYAFSGRRQSIRRKADRKTNLYVDRYDSHLLIPLILIIALSVLDAYFTIFHVQEGAREINPLMNLLIGYGDIHFVIMKYVVTALGVAMLCILKNLIIARIGLLFILFLYLVVFAHHIFLIF